MSFSASVYQKGFSIVELLIMVAVIGILITIGVVSYGGVTKQTNSAAAATELTMIADKVTALHASTRMYPDNLSQTGIAAQTLSKYNYAATHTNFCLATIPERTSGTARYTDNQGGSKEGSCVSPNACFSAETTSTFLRVVYYYDTETGSSSAKPCSRDVVIPSVGNNLPIEVISPGALAEKHLTSVAIPSSVKTIQDNAFEDNQLQSVFLPDSVTSIGVSAFFDNAITRVRLSHGLTLIPLNAFADNQLATLSIPDSVTDIGFGAFAHNALTSLEVPSSVTSIQEEAFVGNPLRSLVLPESVVSIGPHAFANSQLDEVTIPHSVVTIGAGAFERAASQTITCRIPSGRTFTNTGCTTVVYY